MLFSYVIKISTKEKPHPVEILVHSFKRIGECCFSSINFLEKFEFTNFSFENDVVNDVKFVR